MIVRSFETNITLPDGTTIFCKIYNRGLLPEIHAKETTIIALHGGPGLDHTLMIPFWSQLASDYQIILPDLRGCGRSSKSSSVKWNLASWSEDVAALIKGLKLNAKPFLAGSSFGGYVTLKYATQFRESIAGIILCDTEGRMDREKFFKRMREKVNKLGKDDPEIILNAANNFFNDPTEKALGDYVQHCLPYYQTSPKLELDMSQLIFSPEVLKHFNLHELFSFDLLLQLKNITIPVLYLSSGINPYHASESANETASAMVNTHVDHHVFAGVGSEVCFHEPEKCKNLIQEFISKIPDSDVS